MIDSSFIPIAEAVISDLKGLYSTTIVDLWFSAMKIKSIDKNKITLIFPNDFKKDMAEKLYLEPLNKSFNKILGVEVILELLSAENINVQYSLFKKEEEKEDDDQKSPSAYSIKFNHNYTFENFVVGKSNELAHNASLAVANNPALLNNPLFLYGPSGLGKTHLLFAIVNQLRKNFSNYKILYVTGEEFTNELVDSIAQKKPMAFRSKYRSLDVLLVDDVQFLANKMGIQEEFFHTFDSLYKLNKQIILVSDCPPKSINNLEERLKSRFEMGLVADIQPPDLELRVAIFKIKSLELGINLPSDVLTYLAENIKINIRQIEGSLKKLKAHSLIGGLEINLELAKSVLDDFLRNAESSTNIIENIMAFICKRYNITKDDIMSQKRNPDIAYARHLCVYLTRQLTSFSQKNIAKIFSRKDHTTVYNSILVIEKKLQSDPSFEKEIQTFTEEILRT